MTEPDGLHVVVGASGGTGSALLRVLAGSGRRIRAVNRSGRMSAPPGVDVVGADATDRHAMWEACRGAAVVYNCVNPPFQHWRELFPAAVQGVLAGAAAAGAVHVFADDTWMYGKVTGPMTEDLPYRPASDKGVLRAWLAEMVLAAHSRGEVPAVIGRGAELYGPRVESLFGANLFGAALAGRTQHWLGDPDLPLTPLFIDDFARGLVVLGERSEALGGAWHVPHAPPVTGRHFTGLIAAAAGSRHRLRSHGSRTVRALGLVSPLARAGAELVYQFEQPFVVDSSAFARAFGGSATPHEDGVRRTLDWYRGERGQRVRRLGR